MIPPFDQPVQQDGYAWWYLDAISDDGKLGLTLIAFIGSVFSPYYAWQRARDNGNPFAHCAINVALYGRRGRWSMTERGKSALCRDAHSLRIGPSGLDWDGNSLHIDLEEWAFPLPRRIRGRIRVHPVISNEAPISLDGRGHHRWTPVWPQARVEVELNTPSLQWSGEGYFDHNTGTEPLERQFSSWHWSRALTSKGPVVLYDTCDVDGQRNAHALHFRSDANPLNLDSPSSVELPASGWRIPRVTRSESARARLKATWEDTPFYARSLISSRLLGEDVTAVHESLSLPRFSAPWVQAMLPFRMPRRSTWPADPAQAPKSLKADK
jgi:carotenoid 1,2-hydratase